MIVHDCEQGTPEWLALRMGIPTASCFHRIVTPTGKLSKQARGYAFYLIAEKLLNRSLSAIDNLEWVARGKELEPAAAAAYEFDTDTQTRKVGFITTDDGEIGASPDRLLIGQNGCLEIKCPAPQTHIEYMVDGFGSDYYPQAQGQLWIAECDFTDRWSYHPDMPPVRHRTFRDEAFLKILVPSLLNFVEMKNEMMERVKSMGVFRPSTTTETPIDAAAAEWAGEDHF